MRPLLLACAAVALLLAAVAPAAAQGSRRDREDPELIVEPGGRTGTCDQLLFTPDGKQLLAAGDDKVVRVWQCRDGKLDDKTMQNLRWGIWREFRGQIHAMALSPDARRVVIGGVGPISST